MTLPFTMLLVVAAVLILVPLCDAQTYCQRGKGFILDTGGQCLRSGDYDVANCCYVCPVQDSNGLSLQCGSLYDLGYATCAETGALAARQAACTAIGGDINAGAFTCQCNGGTNTSQTNYTATSVAPTAPTTASPTNDVTVPTAPMLMFCGLLMTYALLCK